MSRIQLQARDAMYLAVIGILVAVVGVAFGAAGAMVAALASAVVGAYLRSPATREADRRVAALEKWSSPANLRTAASG